LKIATLREGSGRCYRRNIFAVVTAVNCRNLLASLFTTFVPLVLVQRSHLRSLATLKSVVFQLPGLHWVSIRPLSLGKGQVGKAQNSGVACVLVPCVLGQEVFLRPLSTKTTEFEVKIGAK